MGASQNTGKEMPKEVSALMPLPNRLRLFSAPNKPNGIPNKKDRNIATKQSSSVGGRTVKIKEYKESPPL